MKVYLVETYYIDSDTNFTNVERVFATFRGASQWLVDEEFEPYYECLFNNCGISFYYHDEEGFSQEGKIIEMEVEEYGNTNYEEGDIFKIEDKEYRLRFINKHGTCWLEPVLVRDECNVVTGGKNKIFHYDQLSNLQYLNKRY